MYSNMNKVLLKVRRPGRKMSGMSPKVLIIAKVVLALWQSAVQNQYRRTLEVFGFSFVSLCWKLQKQGYITSSGNKV